MDSDKKRREAREKKRGMGASLVKKFFKRG